MISEIKLALKYGDTLPVAVELIEECRAAKYGNDRPMSAKERGKLMSQFWALVKQV
mgnify:CR=1 FL=1